MEWPKRRVRQVVFVEIYLVAFAPLVFLLDLLHFFLGEVVLDVEVLKERLIYNRRLYDGRGLTRCGESYQLIVHFNFAKNG